MKTSKTERSVLPKRVKNAYWRVVEDCLVEIHGLGRTEARTRTKTLREKLDNPPEGLVKDLAYNTEEFYVACDLAGNELDPALHDKAYQEIVERHYGPLEQKSS